MSAVAFDPQKVLSWKIPEIEHTYTEKDTILYALGLGCGSDPGAPGDLQVRLRAGIARPADHAGGAGPPWQLARHPGIDRGLQQGPARRAVDHPASPGSASRNRDRARPRSSTCSTRAGRRAPCSIPSARSSTRRRGSRSPPWAPRPCCAATAAGAASPGPQPAPHRLPETAPTAAVDIEDARQLGPNLPPLRRPQPAARRSGGGRPRRLQDADPARAPHLRRRRPCPRQGGVRRRPGAAEIHAGALLRPGLPRRDHPHRAVGKPSSPRLRGEGRGEGQPQAPAPDGGRQLSFRCRVLERDLVVLNNGLATVS